MKQPYQAQPNAPLGKLPPQATDLEQAVLGAILIDADAIHKVSNLLQADDFYDNSHNLIFHATQLMYDSGEAIDMLTVTNKLRTLGTLNTIGVNKNELGAFYIAELSARVSSSANIQIHALIIIQMAVKRRDIVLCNEMLIELYDETNDVFTIQAKYEKLRFENSQRLELLQTPDIKSQVDAAIIELQRTDEPNVAFTGIAELDKGIGGGFKELDLAILGARPGKGKTDFLLTSAAYNLLRCDGMVVIYSIEMLAGSMINRLFSIMGDIQKSNINNRTLTDSDWTSIGKVSDKLIKSKLVIIDADNISASYIAKRLKALSMKGKVSVAYIDYLQIIADDNQKSKKNEQLARDMWTLNRCVKELKFPIFALAQLGRQVDKSDKRISMGDFADGSAIEKTAGLVMAISNPTAYGMNTSEDGSITYEPTDRHINVLKNRNGQTEDVLVTYDSSLGQFKDKTVTSTFGGTPPPPYNPNSGITPNENFGTLVDYSTGNVEVLPF